MTRQFLLSVVALLTLLGTVQGQYPPQNIPPTRVPETEEPPTADPRKAGDAPEILRPTPLPGAIPGLTAGPARPVSNDPPTPVVTIHVAAPASTSAGADIDYVITVENRSQAAAHHVRVTNPIPDGMQFQSADPVPTTPNPNEPPQTKQLVWKLDTLKPGDKRVIKLTLRPNRDGMEAVENTARVHFEHGQRVRTILHRPQLVLKKLTHQHALEKQPISCKIIVENTGEVGVQNIIVNDVLGENLEFVENGPGGGGPVGEWKIAALGPKQKKEITYSIRATKQGTLTSKVEARADRGVKAEHPWQIVVGPSPLTVELTGPKQVYLNYPAKYQITVKYAGSVPLDNVQVAFSLPKGMRVTQITPGAQDFKDRVQWSITRLNPRETRTYTISVQASTAGVVPQFVQVLWRGPEQRAEFATDFLGSVALQLDVRESNDPVRIGEKVRYQITVSNRGTTAAKDVKLYVKFPNFILTAEESDGQPGKDGGHVIMLPEVPAKGQVTKTITLRATAAGKAIVHVEMESAELTSGNVTREEPTTITD